MDIEATASEVLELFGDWDDEVIDKVEAIIAKVYTEGFKKGVEEGYKKGVEAMNHECDD